MFEKIKFFWSVFWESAKTAYDKAFKEPITSAVQQWRDIGDINFLDIFVNKLNNLVNTEATFDIESDSTQSEPIRILCKDLEEKRYEITALMLADGDAYVFPATDSEGNQYHSVIPQHRVRIVNMDGDKITEAFALLDWVTNNNKTFYLIRHHKLVDNSLQISYNVVNENNGNASVPKWDYLKDDVLIFNDVNNIGFGRYKSPASARGNSAIYGVPLNYGCSEIEKTIKEDLKLIKDEFKNGKSVIFTDPRNLIQDKTEYKLAENIIPINARSGQSGNNIDIFNPTLRFSEHYSKLIADLGLYEKQVGTSKGILTDNETTESATATAVKRANSDTLALIDKIRNAIDKGNKETLEADAMILNVSSENFSYTSDWYDPFEDASEQWERLLEAKREGAVEISDLLKWLYPKLNEEQIEEKIKKIEERKELDTEEAINRALGGA